MKWVLWREYRLNRLILIVGVVLLFLPYVVALIVFSWAKTEPTTSPSYPELFSGAAFYSLVLSQLAMALIGGNAIAGERADRSAEFMAYLPVPRARRLVGKWLVALSMVTLSWGLNLLTLMALVLYSAHKTDPDYVRIFHLFYYVAVAGMVFYGVGWFISSFQSSPTFAVAGGLITPMLVVMGLNALAWLLEIEGGSSFQHFTGIGYTVICVPLAIVCFSVGTCYYLRRVEP